MSEWCELCDLERAFCEHRDGKPAPVDDRPLLGVIVVAKFPGICEGCGERIEEGDHIGRPDDEEDNMWYHYGCGR